MKSEHRHQLKTNELAEWLANFPQWAKENATTIIYVSVVAVLVGGVYIWKVYEEKVIAVRRKLAFTSSASQLSQDKARILRAQTRGVDIAYTLIQTADNLRDIARNAKEDNMAALILIKRAEALRAELHYRFGSVNKENLTEQINRARESYTEALEKASGDSTLTAMAKFGLGLCEEELGNFEQARQIYNEIVTNPDFQYTVIVPQAQQRLDTMDAYKQEVTFRPAPKRQQPAAEAVRLEFDARTPQGLPSQMGPFRVPEVDMQSQEPNSALKATDFNLPGLEYE